jgi:hypothetical protein
MFGLEAYAKLFDKIHEENRRSLNIEFQGWINDIYRSDGESWRFYGAAATAAAADAIYAFAGGLAPVWWTCFGLGMVLPRAH